jgi:replication factor C subunit 3/5
VINFVSFSSPLGTGKTSTILAVARAINGPKYSSMILELNASDDRGIDVVRDQIKDFASSRKLFSTGFKLIILDEADAMTKTAQFALRRIIEKYTKNTRFCIICNYVNKIIPALQSRCTKFRFGPLENSQVRNRLQTIANSEKILITEEGISAILKLSGGDMRKCLNIMQSAYLSVFPAEISEKAVYLTTGQPLPSDVIAIFESLLNHSMVESMKFLQKMQVEKGISLIDIITNIHEVILRTSFPPNVLAYILAELAAAEGRLAAGTSEKIQLAGFVGIFQHVKAMVAEQKQQSSI